MASRRTVLMLLAIPASRAQKKPPNMFTDAEAYDRFMGRWSHVAAPLLIDFAVLPQSGKALDVGSGTGSLAFAIARRNPNLHVVGIDPSRVYVEHAARMNPFHDRVHFQAGDARRLAFEAAAFQASLSLFVFNFIPQPETALRELRRVTAPGGRISAAVWDYSAGMRMLRAFWDAAVSVDPAAEKLDEKHMPLCRAGELSELWKREGLAEIDEKPLDITMRFQSFADYWEPFLLGQGPGGAYVLSMNGVRLETLRQEVKRRLALTSENAPFELPARAWAVRGTVPAG